MAATTYEPITGVMHHEFGRPAPFTGQRVVRGAPCCKSCGRPYYPRVSDTRAEEYPIDYMDGHRVSLCGRCEHVLLQHLAVKSVERKRQEEREHREWLAS